MEKNSKKWTYSALKKKEKKKNPFIYRKIFVSNDILIQQIANVFREIYIIERIFYLLLSECNYTYIYILNYPNKFIMTA